MLKILKLRKQLELTRTKLKGLEEKSGSFALRAKQLETAMEEAKTEEEIALVEGEGDSLEKEKDACQSEMTALGAAIEPIEGEISALERNAPSGVEPEKPKNHRGRKETEAGEMPNFATRNTRENPFRQTRDERRAYLQRDDVKEFYETVLALSRNRRAVDNAEVGIPEITIGLIRDTVADYSALLRKIDLRTLRGDARLPIAGSIPEAIWTECCANINELSISFDVMNMSCHMVSGYIPVCNATLEDFAINGIAALAAEIEYNLLEAIGRALDKAIIYGDGIHMPLGFVSSLPMTQNPVDSTKAWSSYAATNVKAVSGTGTALFQNILKAVGAARRHGGKVRTFIMNQSTWDSVILPESLAISSAGAMVAATGNTFPAVGGDVIILDFIPDGDIVGGYLDRYVLAERAGIKLAMSEHVLFLQNNTVYKATARYDGSPATSFRDSFFAINITGGTPTTTLAFPPDTANTPESSS